MAEGAGMARWSHTALICMLIANTNLDPKKHRPFKPADFDPYALARDKARHAPPVATKEDLSMIREAFTRGPWAKKDG